MERLTEKHYLGTDHYMKCSGSCNVDMDCIDCPSFDCLVERLAAYEDTGMTPEVFQSYVVFLQDLIGNQKASEALDRFRWLAEADKDGRVMVLPVRPVLTQSIGSMLYIIEEGEIFEDSLCEALIGMESNGEINIFYTTLSDQISFEQADIGKTVFLTREEAEKALGAMKDGNG
ncbi:hypothetical protein MM35RIKEN_16560 (plasmid) [Vescimonas fastidiosa]|uniref:Uncharacterized protein n=1 Tax=Vescimonas fastidiosa TaxID=2714353 RepID=A0A810PUQ8_9FIRM|nr:hypothetical protein [Vescimonas fastidiosa]BCK79464.1 hypothetical protein MM35RIKEN_16560 [Vescimonas fastidiosa]